MKDNGNKKEARRQRRAERSADISAFFRRHKRGISLTVLAVFSLATILLSVLFAAADGIAKQKVAVGELAANILRYDKPASKISRRVSVMNAFFGIKADYDKFQQASLPVGSGDLGAAIFGETDVERIVFNEKTLWSGGPDEGQTNYNGDNFTGVAADGLTESQRYYAVQELLLKGDTAAAEKLFKNMQGDTENKGAYLAFANVYLDFGHKRVKNYSRSLDIDNAVASVSYDYKGSAYRREYIASNPDKVIAIKLSGDAAQCFGVSFPSMQSGATVTVSDGGISISGVLSDNGLKYYARLFVDAVGGKVTACGEGLRVEGASTAYIYLSASTDYKQEFPVYRTGESAAELQNRVNATVDNAVRKGYAQIREAHVADYKSLYDRVALNLGGVQPDFSTDRLVRRYSGLLLENRHRRYLEQLVYNYGRYLLISCSRADSALPANLQGVWNASNDAPWQSDYHLNVNLQMNYWAAYNANLAECAAPLIEYVDALRAPGRITAKTYTATEAELAAGLSDAEYGFIANTEGNPYGHTTPGSGKYVKAMWSPAAVAWLMQNLYEGYEYGGDVEYLERIYPIMKEALLYFERTMVMHNGRLITAPSYSPEHGKLSAGTAYEQSLVWQLLTDTIEASKTLDADADKRVLWLDMLDKINPIEIGQSGQIKEWYYETYYLSRGKLFHRHTSHLLGLFPGDLIQKDNTPEWAAAAEVSLDKRGNYTTGWAMGQRINTLARLGRGEKAFKMVGKQLKNGIYANLLDAHPPFQIDGNFGYTAGVTEMLIQSNGGYIELLPAYAEAWCSGEVRGLRARGNFGVSLKWENGKILRAEISSDGGRDCTIAFAGVEGYKVVDERGNDVDFYANGGKITFQTERNARYFVIPQ